MSIISELVLIESKSARDERMLATTHEKAEDALSKAKALLYFAMHQGNKIATTEQIAEFYEVPIDTVRSAYSRHKDEFISDGVVELKGKALKGLLSIGHDSLKLPESVTRLMVWTPRGTLRLGMLLRDSEVAKAVRTTVLDATEESGEKSERIRELELQLAIAQANNSTVLTQERLMLTGKAIVDMHGASMLALIQGRPDAVVSETEVVRETVMVDANFKPVATFNGMGITEISSKLGFGTTKKALTECRKWLESVGVKDGDWRQEMTAHATAKLPREMMPKLKRLWAERKGNRQLLLGE